jgi:hypothetical protein
VSETFSAGTPIRVPTRPKVQRKNVSFMPNPNWQADFEQALAEQDRSDPFAGSIFQNRTLAKLCVGTAVFPAALGAFVIYALVTDEIAAADHEGWQDFAIKCVVTAVIQVCLGCCALALLKKKSPRANSFEAAQQSSDAQPIGW